MRASMRGAALRREPQAAERIPYTAHVSPSVIATEHGDYVQVFRLAGASFESADDEQLNTWHERLNVLWRNIASPHIALWAHVIRRRERTIASFARESGFAGHLEEKYRRRIAGETLMVNELYLSLVYRPASGVATSLAGKLLSRTHADGARVDLADALDTCEKLAQTLGASLARYEPDLLSVYRHEGRWFSRPLEFLSYLVTGEHQRVPLPRSPIRQVLATTRLFFGIEAIEYRMPTETRIGAMLGIKEYPTPTLVGMFDRLLSAPFPFVLTQSFSFLTKGAG
ncbi:MAG TPA: hypothetical protein VG963_03895, partial [Polyangiaceae bacterium]|nr:hypothetical protein [Polyangiaceae bacterium]